jgi:nucleotide-binding universal stress UspA family protein
MVETNASREAPSADEARPSGSPPRTSRVVCGVDGSPQARKAAVAALALADRLGARLTLAHVSPTRTVVPVDGLGAGPYPMAYAYSEDLAFSDAEDAFTSLPPDITAASFDREIRLGQPAVVLAEIAAEQEAELIVVGSRGRGAWRSAALGSVSADLTRLAPCPVMIVPDRPRAG